MKKKKRDKKDFWLGLGVLVLFGLILFSILMIVIVLSKCEPHMEVNQTCLKDKARVICVEEFGGTFDRYFSQQFQCLENRIRGDWRSFTKEEIESCKEMIVCESPKSYKPKEELHICLEDLAEQLCNEQFNNSLYWYFPYHYSCFLEEGGYSLLNSEGFVIGRITEDINFKAEDMEACVK